MKLQHSSPRRGLAQRAGRGEFAEGVLIFLHVPKTAGSTLLRILERQYGRDSVLDLYDSTFGDEVADLTTEQLCRTRVITGHFYFGLHRHLAGTYRYLTLLRDPVERVVSHYHFVRRQPDHYLYPAASTMSLTDYVELCGAAEPNNDQTRLLAGKEVVSSDGTSSPAMLPAAKRNLDSHATVGLTEAFDESLILMRLVFGWRRPFHIRQNVDRRRSREDLPAQVKEVIHAYNALDVELYRHGRERFERQVAEQGDAFARKVRAFTRLNAAYSRFAATRLGTRRV